MSAWATHESKNYRWDYDSKHGTGTISRKSDGAAVFLQGDDCSQMERDLHRLMQKTSSPRYPTSAPTFGQVFESIVSEYFAS